MMAILKKAYLAGHEVNELRSIAFAARNWSGWYAEMASLLQGTEARDVMGKN